MIDGIWTVGVINRPGSLGFRGVFLHGDRVGESSQGIITMRRGNVFQGDQFVLEVGVTNFKVQPPDAARIFRLTGEIHLLPNETLALGRYTLKLIERDNRTCEIEVTHIDKSVAYFSGTMNQP